MVELVLESGKRLKLTPDHRVARVDGGWVEAQELRPGDQVLVDLGAAGRGVAVGERVSEVVRAGERGDRPA